MGRGIESAFAVLTAIAEGANDPASIADALSLDERIVATHLDALSAGGFIRSDGGQIALSERLGSLLADLSGRSDLVAIAGPSVLSAEARLGITVTIEIPQEPDPAAVVGAAPFAVTTDAEGRPSLLVCVLDNAGEIACVLRAQVDGAGPEEIELLGKELVIAADAISSRLPLPKDRGHLRRR